MATATVSRKTRATKNVAGDAKKTPAPRTKVGREVAEILASSPIQLNRLGEQIVEVSIRGMTPVIPHAWSKKALAMMPGHPDGDNVKKAKGKRDPVEEAEGCLYRTADGQVAVRAVAYKAAMVGACRFFKEPSMKAAKLMFSVDGEGTDQLVPFEFDEQVLHEDTPRNANGGADLRYRYYFGGWRARLRIRYVPSVITAESVVALLDAAGRGGVCDWRPSAPKSDSGTFGTWRVDDGEEIKILPVT